VKKFVSNIAGGTSIVKFAILSQPCLMPNKFF
jgi:hypothetical protein